MHPNSRFLLFSKPQNSRVWRYYYKCTNKRRFCFKVHFLLVENFNKVNLKHLKSSSNLLGSLTSSKDVDHPNYPRVQYLNTKIYAFLNTCKDPFIPLARKDLLPNEGLIKLAQKFWSEKLVCWCIFSAFATSVFSVCPGSRAIFGQKCHATFLNFKNWEVKY